MSAATEQFPDGLDAFFFPHEVNSAEYGTRLMPHAAYTLSADQPLYDKPTAQVQYGFNGSILGIMTLPKQAGQEYLQFALIDYGIAADTDHAVLLSGRPGQPLPQIFGYAQSRFGLQTLNPTNSGWPVRYAPLPASESSYTFGRSTNVNNIQLGITEGHTAISRAHFLLAVQGNTVVLTDYSANGTWLLAAPDVVGIAKQT